MNEKIKLYFENDLIGILEYQNNIFSFTVDDNYENLFILSLLNFSDEKFFSSPNLFYIFDRFLPAKSRIDIIEEANIEKSDDVFTILCKVASLNLDKDQFWIGK